MSKYLKINEKDNVVVCLEPMVNGQIINQDNMNFELKQDVPAGHKVAIKDIKRITHYMVLRLDKKQLQRPINMLNILY